MPAAPAPNRSTDVINICNDHPEVFVMPLGGNADAWAAESDTRRRAFLIGILIPTLNAMSAGSYGQYWGCLIKDDQAGKIPPDTIVWHPTMEHFDVLTDTRATWIPRGVVTNPAWRWGAVGALPVPTGGAGDGTGGAGGGVDVSALINDLASLRQELRDFRTSAGLDAGVIMDRIDEKFNALVSRLTTLEAAVNSHVFTAPDYEARIFGTRIRLTPVK